ncbi:MAG TPA: hypothetical protein VIT00_04195 [Terrimicrobiaceae bacterium]
MTTNEQKITIETDPRDLARAEFFKITDPKQITAETSMAIARVLGNSYVRDHLMGFSPSVKLGAAKGTVEHLEGIIALGNKFDGTIPELSIRQRATVTEALEFVLESHLYDEAFGLENPENPAGIQYIAKTMLWAERARDLFPATSTTDAAS